MQSLHNPSFVKRLLIECACTAVIAMAALATSGRAAAMWAGIAGAAGIVFFMVVSEKRYREMVHLSCEVDEVLRSGRAIDLADYREGDLAILKNQLAKMIDALRGKTERLGQEKSDLAHALADVSHQIRTPLTAMGLTLAVAQETDDERARARALRELEGMIERVGWLVSALLKLAKADAGAITVQATRVEARQVVARAMGPLAASLDLRGVTCEVHCEGDPHFTGDMAWSAEALENVLKNCMEHTPAGGAIRVSVRQDALACRIRVTDTGPGIAPEDLPHVFERFYRGKGSAMATEGERADGPRAQGFGIGLALAQSLMAAQGGTLRASNAPEGGARFDFTFPSVVV